MLCAIIRKIAMKKTTDEINTMFDEATKKVPVGSCWQHYKGGVYRVIDHAMNTTSADIDVVCQRISGPTYDILAERFIKYSRPLTEWFDVIVSEVDNGELVGPVRFTETDDNMETIDLEVSDEMLFEGMKLAHKRGISFNELIIDTMFVALSGEQKNEEI
jgi:hypothetical protein